MKVNECCNVQGHCLWLFRFWSCLRHMNMYTCTCYCLILCLFQFKSFQLNEGTNGSAVTILSTLCTFKQNSNYIWNISLIFFLLFSFHLMFPSFRWVQFLFHIILCTCIYMYMYARARVCVQSWSDSSIYRKSIPIAPK